MFDLVPFGRRDRRMMSLMDQQLNQMNSLFDQIWNQGGQMRTDIKDEGDHYSLTCDLPGLEKDDIQIDLTGDRLVISVEKKHEEDSKESDRYVYRERSYQSMRRSFNIADIDQENMKATYRNGVLNLTLPKKEQKQAQGRRLEIDD